MVFGVKVCVCVCVLVSVCVCVCGGGVFCTQAYDAQKPAYRRTDGPFLVLPVNIATNAKDQNRSEATFHFARLWQKEADLVAASIGLLRLHIYSREPGRGGGWRGAHALTFISVFKAEACNNLFARTSILDDSTKPLKNSITAFFSLLSVQPCFLNFWHSTLDSQLWHAERDSSGFLKWDHIKYISLARSLSGTQTGRSLKRNQTLLRRWL